MKGKRLLVLLVMAATLCLALVGCGKEELAVTFAPGTTINGMDVTGMTPAQVSDGMAARLEHYTFTLRAGEEEYTFTSEELFLQCAEGLDFQTLLTRQNEDGTLSFTVEHLYTADLSKVEQALERRMEEGGGKPAKDATLTYDTTTLRYVIVPEEYGQGMDPVAVAQSCLPAVLALERELEVDVSGYATKPAVTAQSPDLLGAMEAANAALDLDLTYTFTPQGEATASLTLSRSKLGELYCLDEDLKVQVDREALNLFAAELAQRYGGDAKRSKFRTTHGYEINIQVNRAGQSVDTTKLYEDMLRCLEQGIDGVRVAPYTAPEPDDGSFWGGNYVEVDLTSQQLWLYKNGVCVLNCGVVSGCVYDGTTTSTGVFQIFSKQTDRYLNGYNVDGTKYHTWVNYFLPFNGGIAFHDATWRSDFGGTYYYYDGSHGCVGVSLSNAKAIYDNVSVGTHVVVYGGISKNDLPGRPQTITAVASATELNVGSETNILVSGNKTAPVFTSADPSVVEVVGNGLVRAVGPGTTTITVTCPEGGGYSAATATVTITVTGGQEEHHHSWTEVVETITHPPVYEQQEQTVVKTVTLWVCDGCQTEFATEEEARAHAEGEGVTWSSKTVEREVTELVDVLVREEWTETITRLVCSQCGEAQSE